MTYFDRFFSNSLAPHNTQKHFCANEQTTTRTFARVRVGGEHLYSFLFANTVASTFADGSESFANYVCDAWELHEMTVSLCDDGYEPRESFPVTFGGKRAKTVAPGEIFFSDPMPLSPKDGENLAFTLTYRGREIPYTEETRVRTMKKNAEGVFEEGHFPAPAPIMVGCDRPVRTRVAFIGDSITMGCGTPIDSYAGYACVASSLWEREVAVWNVALGYGRGADAATGGLWHYEAKQADTVFVCFGVNDIYRGFNADQLINSLENILTRLKAAGVSVIMQTIPPYDYPPHLRPIWEKVNGHIISSMAERADGIFDVVPVLSKSADEPHLAKFGGHPNSEGNRLWGEALAEEVRRVAEKRLK